MKIESGCKRQLEDSRKTIEEATQVIVKDDAEKTTSLASEVEALKKNQDLLVKSISQNLGYVEGKPVAACLIYKCLIHWRSFEIEETKIFDLIVQAIASAIEVPYNNEVLAYWLSNLAMLLCLMQHTFTSATIPASQGCMRGAVVSSLDRQERQVVPKHPAILFMQQLIGFIEKIYEMIRDNLKIEISLLLGLCLQEARTKRNVVPQQQALTDLWQIIVERLSSYLNLMKANNVPSFLVSKVFTQVFSFTNVELFNSFLLRRECCTINYGEYVEAGLAKLEPWCLEATDEYVVGSAWDELRHVRQAVGFLVIRQKKNKTLDELTREICPVLSIKHIYRISTMYWDDKYGTLSVSSDVVKDMRVMMSDSRITISSSFLLDHDFVPFSVEDITKSMEQVDVNGVEPPQSIRENAGFSFLLTGEEEDSVA